MNNETGKIKPYSDLTEYEKKSGKWDKIPDDQVQKVRRMNRRDRLRWAKLQRQSAYNQRGEKRN